jgi:Fe-S-cluster-containing dehydrogenase component
MINFDFIDRAETIGTAAYVCWHCDDPTCAQVCPADAIKKGEDGVVLSALKPRCIACSNCVLACPFGIPKIYPEYEQMMKCDMCYDRTSAGKRPMCATVCPALAYVRIEEIAARREKASNVFHFGNQTIATQVYMMTPPETDSVKLEIHVTRWSLDETSLGAYSVPTPGHWDKHELLRRPVGAGADGEGTKRLFFAGEGTARAIYNGSYPGAYESGVEAARVIHAAMVETPGRKRN